MLGFDEDLFPSHAPSLPPHPLPTEMRFLSWIFGEDIFFLDFSSYENKKPPSKRHALPSARGRIVCLSQLAIRLSDLDVNIPLVEHVADTPA